MAFHFLNLLAGLGVPCFAVCGLLLILRLENPPDHQDGAKENAIQWGESKIGEGFE